MAPRTAKQQKAYNAKRRAETAAKKVAPAPSRKSAVPKKKAKPVKAKAIETKRDAKARAKIEDMSVKPKTPNVGVAHVPKAKFVPREIEASPLSEVVAAISKAKPEPKPDKIEQVGGYTLRTVTIGEPIENIKVNKLIKPLVVGRGEPPFHTMPRSYVRHSGAGLGKLRNGTYQCTVSFTEPQMLQVRAASQLRNVSLAEMIRSCVVEHLNKGIK